MGALNQPGYDSLDDELETKGYKPETIETETSAGALKHNVAIGIDAGTISSTREVEEVKARESEPIMANNLLTQVDSNNEAVAVMADEQSINALMGKTYEEKPIWTEL